MTITALPTPPNRSMPQSTFTPTADAFLAALPTFVTETNAVATAMTLNATNDTSTTSVTIGTGTKTFTVSPNKSFQPGMWVSIANTPAPNTLNMTALVTSYNATTGNLVVDVKYALGSSTLNAWTISQSGFVANVIGDHEITVHTGNGYGSTNTKIRRFTTTLRQAGTAVQYVDDAVNGATFTIVDAGLYEVNYTDVYNTASSFLIGVTVNATNLTTSVNATPVANRIVFGAGPGGAAFPACVTRTVRLFSGDVVRPHTDGQPNATTASVLFSIRKVGL